MADTATNQSEVGRKVEEFLEYLQVERGASPLTIRNYRHYLKRLQNFLFKFSRNPKIKDINEHRVNRFKEYLANSQLSKKTQGFHLISLRSFLRWLRKKGFKTLEIEMVEVPKVSGTKLTFISGREIDNLLNAPNLSTINGVRDKAILELFFATGLRVSELVGLDKGDVNFQKGEIFIKNRAKKKIRPVLITRRAAEWLEKYLSQRKDKFNPLFIRYKGGAGNRRLTPRSVQRMVKKYIRKMKLKVDVTPKTIRHTFATDLLMAGADIRSVQEMLGHKNISTTQIYTHVTNKQLRDIHSAFHGKGR